MLYIPKYNLLLLELPKCGTTSIRQAFIKYCLQNNISYIDKKSCSTGLWKNPDNYEYRHCNYLGCENFCNKNGIDINKIIILMLIRDPIERYKSAIKFYKNIFNINAYNFINHEYYNNFFIYNNYVSNNSNNINLVRLEQFSKDYNLLCLKYNLPKICTISRLNKSKECKINLNKDVINTIYKDNEFLYKQELYTHRL